MNAQRPAPAFPRNFFQAVCVALVLLGSCGSPTQEQPPSTNDAAGSEDFSARAETPVSVVLQWLPVDGATGYRLDARYGDGDFIQVAGLGAEDTSYLHFTVPGSASLEYRLTALTGGGEDEIGTLAINMPELVPSPLVLASEAIQMFLPAVTDLIGGLDPGTLLTPGAGSTPDLTNLATPDISSLFPGGFDPDNPTAFDPSSLIQDVSVTQQVGPEGGIVTLTAPNGVVYTLFVPAYSLEQVSSIKLLPIENIVGTPMSGGVLAAVAIAPPVPFYIPAKLTIALPEDMPAPAAPLVVGFGVSSLTREFYLAPADSEEARSYTLDVFWGDVVGLAAATQADLAAQSANVPTDAGDLMSQQLALLLTNAGPENELAVLRLLKQGLLEQLDTIIVQAPANPGTVLVSNSNSPLARGAFSSPYQRTRAGNALASALQTAMGMYVRWAGLNNPDLNPQFLLDQYARKIKAFLDKALSNCLTEDDFYARYLVQMLTRYMDPDHPSRIPTTEMVSVSAVFWRDLADRYRALFGVPTYDKSCSYELLVQSRLIISGQSKITVEVSTTDPIRLELVYRGDRLALRGVRGLEYRYYEVAIVCPPPVIIRKNRYPAPVLWITDLLPQFDEEDNLVNFKLRGVFADFEVGNPGADKEGLEGIENTPVCKNVGFNFNNPPDMWGLNFTILHNGSPYDGQWTITTDGTTVKATANIVRTVSDVTENTVLTLNIKSESPP